MQVRVDELAYEYKAGTSTEFLLTPTTPSIMGCMSNFDTTPYDRQCMPVAEATTAPTWWWCFEGVSKVRRRHHGLHHPVSSVGLASSSHAAPPQREEREESATPLWCRVAGKALGHDAFEYISWKRCSSRRSHCLCCCYRSLDVVLIGQVHTPSPHTRTQTHTHTERCRAQGMTQCSDRVVHTNSRGWEVCCDRLRPTAGATGGSVGGAG